MDTQAARQDLEVLRQAVGSPDASRLLHDKGADTSAFLRYLDGRLSSQVLSNDAVISDIQKIEYPDFPLTLDEPTAPRTIDDDALRDGIDTTLSGLEVAGYCVKARRNGETVFTLTQGLARLTIDENPVAWAPNVKMHVASVSKLVTSMAVTRLLFEKGIDVDTPVAGFLPRYFVIHPTTRGVTFRQLLTHTAGFEGLPDGPNDGYTFVGFRFHMEKGVDPAKIGTRIYNNANFIGLRIALSGILETADLAADFGIPGLPGSNETYWDHLTAGAYLTYVKRHILARSSVVAGIEPGAKDSLAYTSDLTMKGIAASVPEGVGTDAYWFSVDEILDIMSLYWHGDAIVPQRVARQALRLGFGVDTVLANGEGIPDCFTKFGDWTINGAMQHCMVAFGPGDTLIAAFMNSTIPSPLPMANVPRVGWLVQPVLQASIRA